MGRQTRAGVRLCLNRAAECKRLAELSTDVLSRETYLHMATQWSSSSSTACLLRTHARTAKETRRPDRRRYDLAISSLSERR